jgi:hypothetical protein
MPLKTHYIEHAVASQVHTPRHNNAFAILDHEPADMLSRYHLAYLLGSHWVLGLHRVNTGNVWSVRVK